MALSHFAEFVNVLTTDAVAVPYLTLRVPLNEQVSSSCAQAVQVELAVDVVEVAGAVVVVVVVGVVVVTVSPYQHCFHWPTAGSPNVALSHVAEPVNVLTTDAVAVPYLTLRVPLNEHVSFSCAQAVQVELAVLEVVVVVVVGLR